MKIYFVDHKGITHQAEATEDNWLQESIKLAKLHPAPKLTFRTSNPDFKEIVDNFNNRQ